MSRRLFLLVTLLLAALSCRKKDAFEPIDCQYFVEVTAEQRFTFDQLMEQIKLKIPADWTPKSLVFLFHAKDDSFVPRLSADALAERWKAAGADMQYTVFDTDLHLDTFFLMAGDFVQQLP